MYTSWSTHLRSAGPIEGVGFKNVSTSLQELSVDVSNDVWACVDQQVIVAPELMRVRFIAIPSEVLFSQPAAAGHASCVQDKTTELRASKKADRQISALYDHGSAASD